MLCWMPVFAPSARSIIGIFRRHSKPWRLAESRPGHFADYAGILAKNLGDRITTWAPFNMPWTFTYYGYGIGVFPPGKISTSF
jgi:beta-glucosidase/6-phospho-beta-glucosidase/beta-galactosidase